MYFDRRELNIITRDAHRMRDEAIANAFISAWRGGKFVVTRLAGFTANQMRAASAHIGQRLRHE